MESIMKQKALEAYAGHKATISCWVLTIVKSLSIASIGARLRVVALALAEGEVLVAHVAARAGWSIDGSAKFLRTSVAADGRWWGSFVVRCSSD